MTSSERPAAVVHYEIDRASKLPLYIQIEQNLRNMITNGLLAHGDPIPSDVELAERYGASRLTVRRASEALVRQGWLLKRQGVGTFVERPKQATIAPSKLSFTQQMLSVGRQPGNYLISLKVVPADTQCAKSLSLPEGDPVVEIVRLRLADGIPLLVEEAFLSSKRFKGLEHATTLGGESLYHLLQRDYGVTIARMDQTLKPVILTMEQASLLGLRPGSPSIHSEVVAFHSGGEPVEYSCSVANGDHCAFYFSFTRGES